MSSRHTSQRRLTAKLAAASRKATAEAQATVEKLQSALADLDRRVDAAIDNVIAAQSDTARADARSELAKLRAEAAALQQAIANAKAVMC